MTHHPTKRRGSRFGFIRETVAELKRVTWLTRREVIYLTALVLIVAIAAGVILGVIDLGFSKVVDKLFLGR